MKFKEAIEVIKNNYPPDNYTLLREALNMALSLLEQASIINKTMKFKEAIEVIKNNYPPDNYTLLREALNMALSLLEQASLINNE